MSATTTCPERERLQSLLDGNHDDPELTAHLDACANCQQLLEHLAQFTPLPRPRLAPEPTADETALHRVIDELKDSSADSPTDDEFALDFLTPSDRPGSLGKFGKYEVEQVIGRGGMGVVLRALDPDLNRIVAIKVIAPQFAANGSMRRRFVREAKAAAAVCNDHVVTIHDVDTSGRLPYLVMQYVPGPSLQERLDRAGPLELKEILRIGMQTAAGLAAAHAQGLIHRDVKPANILLEDDMERVKLTDFGLARAMDDVHITQSAVLAGTPQYMAPEQARGESLDPRADLFSLGCVLYAACVGRPPFRAGSPLVVMKRICEDTPRSIRDQNPNIPGWLERIVTRLLEKELANRFQSAAEVSDLLGRCLAHVQQPKRVPLPAIPGRRTASPRRAAWRRRLAMAATFLALLVCGLGATVITVRTSQGTLVIDVDDPNTKVTIEGDNVLITDPDGTEIRLRAGDYKVKASKDGKVVEDKPITIKRGEKTIVTVRVEKPAAATATAPVPRADNMFTTEFIDAGTVKPSGVAVSQLAISSDGKLVATGSADGSIHLLDPFTGKVLKSFKGHRARIRLVKFFPDRNILVTVSDDGEVKLWDTATGKEVSSLDLPIKPVHAALSPNAKVLAGAAEGQPVRIWDVTTGKELTVFKGDPAIQALAFSPDGKLVATGTPPGTVRLWEPADGRAILRLEPARADRNSAGALNPLPWGTGHDQSVAFSPDGKLLACGTGEAVIRLWDVSSAREVRAVSDPGGQVGIVAFSPDGKHLLSAAEDNAVRVWDVSTGKTILRLNAADGSISGVTFSPDGKRILTISDGAVKLWDAATGKQSPPKIEPKPEPQGKLDPGNALDRDQLLRLQAELDAAKANQALAVANLEAVQAAARRREALRLYAETLRAAQALWEQGRRDQAGQRADTCHPDLRGWEWHYLKRLAAGEKAESSVTSVKDIRELAFSADGRRLARACADGTVSLGPANLQGDGFELAVHAQDVQAVAFSPDGKLLATGSTDDTARIWDGGGLNPVTAPLKHKGAVHAVAFSPDGRHLATADAFGVLSVWDAASGKLSFENRAHVAAAFGVAYSPDGKRLASVGFNRQVCISDAANGKQLAVLTGHTAAVVAVAFSPDGKRLATAGLDKTARIWDVETGKEMAVLQGHGDAVHALAYSPDGKRLATASADKTVKLWDVATGQEVLTLKSHAAKVTGVAFSPDGKLLATCGEDKRIVIYDGSPKEADGTGATKPAEKTFRFELRDKPWSQVLDWLADQSGLAFVGSAPTGTFTFAGPRGQRYTLTEIVDILNESLLNQRQPYLLVRGNRSFRIVAADERVDPALVRTVRVDELDKHGKTELVWVSVPVRGLDHGDLKGKLKDLTGPFGSFTVSDHSLTLRDTVANVKRILDAIESAAQAESGKQSDRDRR